MWLSAGDRNTKLFHTATIANRRKIFIPAIKDGNGHWRESREEIGKLLIEEFSNLYRAEDIKRSECMGEFISNCVTREDNKFLEAIPSEAKIWNVVKNMHVTKAPGPDGMPALFSKNSSTLLVKMLLEWCKTSSVQGYCQETSTKPLLF